jgi:tetratricopeptide (TPR) repeat protein
MRHSVVADPVSAIQHALELFRLDRFDDALRLLDGAIASNPGNGSLHESRAFMLRKLGRHQEAIQGYRRAISLGVRHPHVLLAYGFSLLSVGDFIAGFALLHQHTSPRTARQFPWPLWSGESSLRGKTILLHSDLGFGDAIQFVRYVRLVADAEGRSVVSVQPPLVTLLASIPGVNEVISLSEAHKAKADYHCPLMSLPFAFQTTPQSIPTTIPYLFAPPARLAKWQLKPSHQKRIGFAFRGTTAHAKERDRRAIGLEPILPLLANNTGFEWWCLQKDITADEAGQLNHQRHAIILGDQLHDFADTAAVIAQLDLVISIDTSVAHLAAAQGKPLLVLSQFAPDWRWASAAGVVQWYPAARVICQKKPGDWASAIDEVQVALAKTVP